MIAEKILGNLKDINIEGKALETVSIEWFELDKKLLRKETSAGNEIGLRMEHRMEDGDILFEDEKHVIAVEVVPCELVSVQVGSMQEMGRLCFELGNRHLSLAIEEDKVTVPYDEPTYLYLKKLGFAAEKITDKFTHFTVCHAHGHSHAHHHDLESDEN